jgi:hypothetical protein
MDLVVREKQRSLKMITCTDVADAFDCGWSPEAVAAVFRLNLTDVLSFYNDYIEAYETAVLGDSEIQRGFDNFRE